MHRYPTMLFNKKNGCVWASHPALANILLCTVQCVVRTGWRSCTNALIYTIEHIFVVASIILRHHRCRHRHSHNLPEIIANSTKTVVFSFQPLYFLHTQKKWNKFWRFHSKGHSCTSSTYCFLSLFSINQYIRYSFS